MTEESAIEYGKSLTFAKTTIDGLIVLDLPVHGDNRGWFKENYQRAKMSVAGAGSLPDLKIVQNNVSFNESKGTTRGIHAEPWDKFISVAAGRIFGAWVDLRAGSATYGEVFTAEIDASKAIFVPRGVGNSFQALEDNTAYTYLVNDHWSAAAQSVYTFVNLGDPDLNIQWPIPLDQAELSDKDRAHPQLKDAEPMRPKKTLVIGANGQLGRAVIAKVAADTDLDAQDFIYTDIADDAERGIVAFDMTSEAGYAKFDWPQIGAVVNCAAYTAVDVAETQDGRALAWKLNSSAPAILARYSNEYGFTLVHISSDYVFDGTVKNHGEGEDFAPLGVYGQTKAAGDIAVSAAVKHYILRTSWVIGDGKNFVKTMEALANKGVKPTVVADQFGRLTFTSTLADAVFHLLKSSAQFGTYNVSNSGAVASWAELAAEVFELSGKSAGDVTPITTEEYNSANAKPGQPISPRPTHSDLDLSKITATGFTPAPWEGQLRTYLHPVS
jgi:dTDP-4-dehydrorhamnose 3,5-epimerase